jgi:hypothetical protein
MGGALSWSLQQHAFFDAPHYDSSVAGMIFVAGAPASSLSFAIVTAILYIVVQGVGPIVPERI